MARSSSPTKRDALLDAALELFADATYAGTTVPDIAARAGVAAGTLYRYFPNKEALVNAVYVREKMIMLEVLTASGPAPAGTSTREEFGQWWRALWRFASDRPLGLAFLETQHHAPYLDVDSLALSARVDAAAADVVRRGQRAGAVRPAPPDVLVALAFGAFVGLLKSGAAPTAALVTLTEDAVWALLARPEET